ncbi:MAG: hypothetical protein AAFU73_15205 [Planctomycetota bacterium]
MRDQRSVALSPESLLPEAVPAPSSPRAVSRRSAVTQGIWAPLLVGPLLLGLGACSGSDGGANSGELVIRSCSIGCSNGSGGAQVSCFIRDVSENQEISILFSEPVDPSSLNSASLQVTDAVNGTSPEGLRFVDPLDPRRVVFRPSVTFDSGGLSFSLETNGSYEILIPGESQGDAGPFIRSVTGRPNQSRMRCSIDTTQGIADSIPGNPQVTVSADVVTSFDMNGDPATIERVVLGNDPNNPIENVSRDSLIYIDFNELMFLPSVADNSTMTSPFIRVQFDTDGNLATQGGDRVDLAGEYEFDVDLFALTTSLVFDPTGQIPSAGADLANPNILVVSVPPEVTDAVGNPVTSATGGGNRVAVPEQVLFGEILLPDADGENFTDGSLENAADSSAGWGDGGILDFGATGGSGRLGRLVVGENQTFTLNTDGTGTNMAGESFDTFPTSSALQIDVLGNPVGGVTGYPRSIQVTDGVFEFASLELGASATLNFVGSNAPRLVVRGQFRVAPGARILINGESAASTRDSSAPQNRLLGEAPAGGPTGGDGGAGADRADADPVVVGADIGAVANPGANRAGAAGSSVGGTAVGGGGGASGYPANLITVVSINEDGMGNGDVGFNFAVDPLGEFLSGAISVDPCIVQMIAGPGGGGGYSTNGGDGTVDPLGLPQTESPAGIANTLSDTSGGNVTGLGLATPSETNAGYDRRILRWQNGHLVGGAGGGGGGNHLYGTHSQDTFFGSCVGDPGDPFSASAIFRWNDHSGGSGGAGGGAIGILAGRAISFEGTIDASGGDGSSALPVTNVAGAFATPGGGGAGGAIRMRAPSVSLTPSSELIVQGGAGGTAPWSTVMANQRVRGGGGANGLVRIEDGSGAIDFDSVVPRVTPFNSLDEAASLAFLSVAPGFLDEATAGTQRPDSMVGYTSCWMRPEGNFLSLVFPDDTGDALAEQAWTMDVVVGDGMGGTTTRPFRGTTAEFPTDWETQFGNLIGYDLGLGETAAPIVVRFQGARARVATLSDPCNVDINAAPDGEVVPGSVTPWVSHPAELNLVVDSTGSTFALNMVRFTVLFDRTDVASDTPGQILTSEDVRGIDNLRFRVTPD